MAEKLLQIDINFEVVNVDDILNGEGFTYQINENFKPLFYDEGDALVNKTFVSLDTRDVDNIFSLKNGVDQNFLGGFNDNVTVIEYFFFKEQSINLIAIGGEFTEYTKNGLTIFCPLFIILNTDGTVFNSIDYGNFIQSGISVNAIKYHEINDSLIIGGKFIGVGSLQNLQNLVELDLINEGVSNSMIEFAAEGSVVGGPVKAIDIINRVGTIICGGGFNQVIGVNARSLFALDSTFKLKTNSLYSNLINSIKSGSGSVEAIHVKQQGELQIVVGGNITTNLSENLAVFNVQGIQIQNFKSVFADGQVIPLRGIAEKNDGYYFSGTFNKYGNQEVNNLIKVDFNGNLDNSFTFDYDVSTVNAIELGEFGFLYISFQSPTLNYNFGTLNLNTGIIVEKLKVLNLVKTIKYLQLGTPSPTPRAVIIGGRINEFSIFTDDLGENEVLYDKVSLTQTRNNLFDNLVEINSRNTDLGFSYSKIGLYKIRIEKIIQNEDIYFLSRVNGIQGKLTISVFRNDANLGDSIINVPIRKDFFIRNIGRNIWSTANFFLTIYQNDFVVSEDNTIEIYKPKITDNQFSQFLNISPLINQEDFESDIGYYDQLDYGTNEPKIRIARLGTFASIKADTLLGETVLETKNEFNFLFDGFRELKPVLINGNKRKYNRGGKITIPFLSDKIRDIDIINGTSTNTITNPNFENVNPEKPEEYISYLCIDFSEYLTSDTTILKFKRDGNVTVDTITLFKGNESFLFYSVKVIFKNSFGALEPTYMNGRSIDSVDTDSSQYKRSIRDINGNIQLPLTHTNKTFNKTGSREWECNTGLVDAYINDCYEDLFMSEEIWLEIDGVLRAVSLESTNFNKKDDLQKDMINYRFNFKEDRNLNE
jgi:hypothetical protein